MLNFNEEKFSMWNKQFSTTKTDQITRRDKESLIRNIVASIGKSDVGEKSNQQMEKYKNKKELQA